MSGRKFMMATIATHKMGDLSRIEPDLCLVGSETETDYIGIWVTGFGFFNVKFPKSTTKELTEQEREHYREKDQLQHSNGCRQYIAIDEEEPLIPVIEDGDFTFTELVRG